MFTKNTKTRTLFVFCSKKQRLAIIMVLLKLRKAIGSKLSFCLYFHMLLKLGGKTDQKNSSSNHTREMFTRTGTRFTVERGNHLVVYPAQLELFLSENDHLTVSAIDIDSESDSSFSA